MYITFGLVDQYWSCFKNPFVWSCCVICDVSDKTQRIKCGTKYTPDFKKKMFTVFCGLIFKKVRLCVPLAVLNNKWLGESQWVHSPFRGAVVERPPLNQIAGLCLDASAATAQSHFAISHENFTSHTKWMRGHAVTRISNKGFGQEQANVYFMLQRCSAWLCPIWFVHCRLIHNEGGIITTWSGKVGACGTLPFQTSGKQRA